MKKILLQFTTVVCICSLSAAFAGTKKYDSPEKTKSLLISASTNRIKKITDYEILNGSVVQVNTESILNKSVMKEDSVRAALIEFEYHSTYWVTLFSEWRTSGWRPSAKNIFYFHNDINTPDSMVTLTYDTTGLKWVNSSKIWYLYNAQGTDTTELIYGYNGTSKAWKAAGRNTNEHDVSGNLVRQTNYTRSTDGNSWVKATKFEHTWSGGVETSYEFFVWNQVAWMGFSKTEYAWYNTQQLKSTTTWLYDFMKPGYVKETLTKQTWQNNLQDTVMAFSWVNETWKATMFDKFHYIQGTTQVRSLDTWKIPDDKSATNSIQFVKTGVSVYEYDDSGNTGISETALANISLFPNPAISETRLFIRDPENCRLDIYDIRGCLIKRLPIYQPLTTIGLHDLVKGTYIFSIENNGEKITRMLIKK